MPAEFEQTRSRLVSAHNGIAETAIETIRADAVDGNPFLLGEEDPRYSLYACGFISGAADRYLGEMTQRMQAREPTMRPIPDGFRHITFGELRFDLNGRKPAGVNAQTAADYYKVLQEDFLNPGVPSIDLVLDRIMITRDKEQNSLSIVAAFVPKNNLALAAVRERIINATEGAHLPLTARLGPLSLMLCTLGRFPHPPEKIGDTVPLLDEVQKMNNDLPKGCNAQILALAIGSTTPGHYPWVDRHAYLIPPIALDAENNPRSPIVIRAPRPARKEVNEPTVNTVIFDFGGVLMDYSDEEWYQAMAQKSGLSVDIIQKFMSNVHSDMMTGTMSESEALQILQNEYYGNAPDQETFFEIDMKMRPDMVNFINQLIEKGVQVAILTNTIPTHWKRIQDMLHDAFPKLPTDRIFASCEIRKRKTGQKATGDGDVFQFVLEQLDVKAQEVIYLDDNPAYTQQARFNGIYAIDVPPVYGTVMPQVLSKVRRS